MKTGFMFASWRVSYVGAVAFQVPTKQHQAEQIAHIFRRCGFGPRPGQVEQWQERGPHALIESLLADESSSALDEGSEFEPFGDPDDLKEDVLFPAYIDQMLSQPNPLHERMSWYWHTHFTTSVHSSGPALVWRQHHRLRRHALGNFASLAREITTDAAMLLYLDGAGSDGANPNENYAREFLEIFTLGRDSGYTEDDVRAAARIFSGWHVDWDEKRVTFNSESTYDRPVSFMGKRQRWTVDSLVSFVCALPACHQHIATRLYHHLVGPDLSDARRNELATAFADSGLEIRALVAEILQGEDFLTSIHSRARQPIEWTLGALHALGFRRSADIELRHWHLETLGQSPYQPPNVAGWPLDDRWSSTSQIIARTSLLLEWELPESTIESVPPTVDAVLARCGIYDPSASTRAALDEIERSYSEFDYRLELLFATALTSPEFTLL